MARLDQLLRLVNEEFHPVEFLQQVVGELDVGLIDLVDQQDRLLLRLERLPDLAADNVVADVVDAFIADLGIAQAGHRVVFVKSLVRLRRRLDVPFEQRPAE